MGERLLHQRLEFDQVIQSFNGTPGLWDGSVHMSMLWSLVFFYPPSEAQVSIIIDWTKMPSDTPVLSPNIQSKAFPAASVHSFFIHKAPTVCPLHRGLTLITIIVIMVEVHLDHQEQMLHPSNTSVPVLKMGVDSQLEHREKFGSTTRRSREMGFQSSLWSFPYVWP